MLHRLMQGGDDRSQTGAPGGAMTREEFWRIVEALNDTAAAPDAKETLLRSWLETADPKVLWAFDDHLQDLVDAAYRWPLWAAAHIIHSECADDCFTHFRACLVFMGRDIYETAYADPDSLSRLGEPALRGMFHEALLYVAMDVYEATTSGVIGRSKPSPVTPAGNPCNEDDPEDLKARCPKLWALLAP